jgi:ABC-type multidrug transport system fused ATPase/permease subunit
MTEMLLLDEHSEEEETDSTKLGTIKLTAVNSSWTPRVTQTVQSNEVAMLRPMKSSSNFGLTDVNFKVKQGEIVMIEGTVGAGKSSLLLTLLKEMHLESGSIKTSGHLHSQLRSFGLPIGSWTDHRPIDLIGRMQSASLYIARDHLTCLLRAMTNLTTNIIMEIG